MERELWKIISAQITQLDRRTPRRKYVHSVGCIVRVYLWAVLHDRPVDWACRRCNWVGVRPPKKLPDQSTMSRRMRHHSTSQMIEQVHDTLNESGESRWIKMLDGKPLTVAKHSSDREATAGRGAGFKARGYKIHAIYAGSSLPIAWSISGLHYSEQRAARALIARLDDQGYLLADAGYDSNYLYQLAAQHEHILLTPRRYPKAKGVGHHRHSPHRLEAIDRLQFAPSPFANDLLDHRRQIETRFANQTNFGGALTHLPPWVRRPHRVALWIAGKFIIRLARDHLTKHPNA